jgi:hypothetical protein
MFDYVYKEICHILEKNVICHPMFIITIITLMNEKVMYLRYIRCHCDPSFKTKCFEFQIILNL